MAGGINGPLPEQQLHEQEMEWGSHLLLRAINHYHDRALRGLPQASLPGPKFRWRNHPCGSNASFNVYERSGALDALHHRLDRIERQRTFRDPCFRCGVRADHGCEHREAA